MTAEEKAFEYNKKIHDALALIYNELNQGQQKKILKNEEVKALLIRYKVIEDEQSSGGK